MRRHFFTSYPYLLMYECGYTSTEFHKRIWTKSTFMAVVCLAANICFTLKYARLNVQNTYSRSHIYECLSLKNISNDLIHLSTDLWFGWRPSSGQHADQHPQFPSQPPADTEPHHASIWSHGHSTEWVHRPCTSVHLKHSYDSIVTPSHGGFFCLSRFKHVAVSDGAGDQQRGGQPGGAAARSLLPAAPQPPPAEPDAAVPQPHEPAAVHGDCHTLAQSVKPDVALVTL